MAFACLPPSRRDQAFIYYLIRLIQIFSHLETEINFKLSRRRKRSNQNEMKKKKKLKKCISSLICQSDRKLFLKEIVIWWMCVPNDLWKKFQIKKLWEIFSLTKENFIALHWKISQDHSVRYIFNKKILRFILENIKRGKEAFKTHRS